MKRVLPARAMALSTLVAVIALVGCRSGHPEAFPRLVFAEHTSDTDSELMVYDSGEFSAWSGAPLVRGTGKLSENEMGELQALLTPEAACNKVQDDQQEATYETWLLLSNGTRCQGRWGGAAELSGASGELIDLLRAMMARAIEQPE